MTKSVFVIIMILLQQNCGKKTKIPAAAAVKAPAESTLAAAGFPAVMAKCSPCHSQDGAGSKKWDLSDAATVTPYLSQTAPEKSRILAAPTGTSGHALVFAQTTPAYKELKLWVLDVVAAAAANSSDQSAASTNEGSNSKSKDSATEEVEAEDSGDTTEEKDEVKADDSEKKDEPITDLSSVDVSDDAEKNEDKWTAAEIAACVIFVLPCAAKQAIKSVLKKD